jgi:hypothetical protein
VSNEKRAIPNSFSYVILKGKSEHFKKEIMREAVPKSDYDQGDGPFSYQ